MPSQRILFFLIWFCMVNSLLWAQGLNPSSSLEEQYQLSIKLGDQFYYSREVPGNAKKALKFYHQALELKPEMGEVYWRLSRAMYGVSRAELDPKLKTKLIQKGILYAEKAVELDPESIDGHLFLGLSYGHYVLHVGLWRAWYYIFPVKREMETILEADPQHSYSHLILGTWYATVPWWMGGDREKGLEHLYQATRYQPNYTTHFLYLSRQLLAMGRKQEAVQALQQIFAIKEPYDPMIAIEDRLEAKQLIEQYQLAVTLPSE